MADEANKMKQYYANFWNSKGPKRDTSIALGVVGLGVAAVAGVPLLTGALIVAPVVTMASWFGLGKYEQLERVKDTSAAPPKEGA